MSEETKKPNPAQPSKQAEPDQPEKQAAELSEQNLDEVAGGRAITQTGIKNLA